MADWMMSMPWEASHGFFALWLAFEKYPSAAFPHPSSLDVRSKVRLRSSGFRRPCIWAFLKSQETKKRNKRT
ncbi:MAG TPA: hypothetical protein PK545_04420 [Deltaproteobacteria bacterium]|nr:hypothetical protein [Deltaproteobacteria bacterium]